MRRVGMGGLTTGPQLAVRAGYGVLRVISTPADAQQGDHPTPPARARGLFDNQRVALLASPTATLGRALDNTVVVPDPTASRHQARLKLTVSGWLIENVSARNPLWVDDIEVGPGERRAIVPGALVRMGATSLQLLAPLSRLPSPATLARTAERVAHTPADPAEPHASAASASAPDTQTSADAIVWADEGEEADDGEGVLGMPGISGISGWTGTSAALSAATVSGLSGGAGITSLSSPWLMGRSYTRLLSPGVTLQYALKGRLPPRMEWLLALVVLILFVVSAVLTLGVTTLVGQSALAVGGLGRVLAALTIPLIPAIGVTIVVLALDRYEREPPLMLLAAFLWGAVIAIPPVVALERSLGALTLSALPTGGVGAMLARAAAQALSAGVVEEVVKGVGLVLLLYFLRDEFDNVTDGALYGALIGAGFGMVENFVYFAVSPRADLGVLIFGRVVLGWLSHSTFTALFGVSLGWLRESHARRSRRSRWLLPVVGLVAAIALHTLFDFVALGADAFASIPAFIAMGASFSLIVLAAEYLPLFGTQAYLLRVVLSALRREAETVRTFLAPEVLAGVVTPEEYVLVQQATIRNEIERQYFFFFGPRAYLLARALFQTATGLAFRKWHVAEGDPPKPTPLQPEDAYRTRIARLRRSLRRTVAASDAERLRRASRPADPTRPL